MAAKKKTTKKVKPETRRRRDRAVNERTTSPDPIKHAPVHEEREREVPPGYAWPEGKALPDAYVVRELQPCPSCKRVKTDQGSQSVVLQRTGAIAYLRCRRPACGHRWQLPVRRV